jgi:hypothetical protein
MAAGERQARAVPGVVHTDSGARQSGLHAPRWPGDVHATPKPAVMLEASSLLVEEPGKPPRAYDPMRTVVLVPS